MKKAVPAFKPDAYKLSSAKAGGSLLLEIQGQKIGPPNKRIVLKQKGLKINSAKITYFQKNKKIEHQIIRINHLPSREEVRLHTASPLYPGNYLIELEFSPADIKDFSKLSAMDMKTANLRKLMPSFDTAAENENIKLEIDS